MWPEKQNTNSDQDSFLGRCTRVFCHSLTCPATKSLEVKIKRDGTGNNKRHFSAEFERNFQRYSLHTAASNPGTSSLHQLAVVHCALHLSLAQTQGRREARISLQIHSYGPAGSRSREMPWGLLKVKCLFRCFSRTSRFTQVLVKAETLPNTHQHRQMNEYVLSPAL